MKGISTAKIVLFHKGSTKLHMNIVLQSITQWSVVASQLLGLHDTLPGVLICL